MESIPSRPLRLADDSKTAIINQIAKYELDIGGHRELMWAYVMTNLAYPIILGKPWMEKNRVIYAANKPSLKIGNRELQSKAECGELNTSSGGIKIADGYQPAGPDRAGAGGRDHI
ncbi:hypothetical protein K3495_g13139 [Podosphaera aphanis]|nr:hypothetical protein K3495_g13139 [Podosphaera aphanis]